MRYHLYSIFLAIMLIVNFFINPILLADRAIVTVVFLIVFHLLAHIRYIKFVTPGYIHHYHIGLVFLLFANPCLRALGLLLMIDDAYQHERQAYEPEFRTFIHRIAMPLYNIRRSIVLFTGWQWLNKI